MQHLWLLLGVSMLLSACNGFPPSPGSKASSFAAQNVAGHDQVTGKYLNGTSYENRTSLFCGYNESEGALELFHYRNNDQATHKETIDHSGNVGKYCDIATTTDNHVAISYADLDTGQLKIAYGTPGSWSKREAPRPVSHDDTAGIWSSIATLANRDVPIAISHYNSTAGDLLLTYGTFDDLQTITLANEKTVGEYSSLIAADSETLYLAFYDRSRMHARLFRLHLNSQDDDFVWKKEEILIEPHSENDIGKWIRVVVDSKAEPVVSYYDATVGAVKLARPLQSSEARIVDNQGNVGMDIDLVIDDQDRAHLTYLDASYFDVKYAVETVSGFDTEVVDRQGITGFYSSIRLENGSPVIAYFCATRCPTGGSPDILKNGIMRIATPRT